MKKRYIVLFIVLVFTLVISIIYLFKQDLYVKKEIKRLEEIIDLKQEINKEYVYLFKETKNNMDEKLEDEKALIGVQNDKILELQDMQKTLQEENTSILEEIEEAQEELDRIIIEQKRIEEERRLEEKRRLEASTVKIDREITYSQFPEYPTGCESIALKILLEYNGIYVYASEIIDKLKKGSLPYKIEDQLYGGNPELEFIGDPRNDYSYGVFNGPIAVVSNSFKENVNNKEGLEFDEVLEIVSQGRPVMVWTTINNISSSISESWIYRSTGETIYWKENEHAVVVIGYNDKQVIVSDPYVGRIVKYNREVFRQNYNYMGKRAVYY